MKKLKYVTIFFFFISSAIFAEWKVISDGGDYLLSLNDKTYNVTQVGGPVKFERVEQLNESFDKVLYIAGQAGTSDIIEVQHALVIRKSDGKKIADIPFLYKSLTNPGSDFPQPQWLLKDNVLKVNDLQSGLEREFSLQ